MSSATVPSLAAQAPDAPRGLFPPTDRGRSQRLIGDLIVDLGFARRETVELAVTTAREQGSTTGQVLLEAGDLRQDQLARALCEHCKRPAALPGEVRASHALGDAEVFEPVGCIRCSNTGYRGRIGLFEVMPVGDEIRLVLLERPGVKEIYQAAIAAGMRTMREDGLDKVRQGLTSLAELARVTSVL